MQDELPEFPAEYFEEIDGTEEGQYLAFLFDDETPVGTLTGLNLPLLTEHLRDHSNRSKYRYVLVQVIDTYSGQTIH